MFKSAFSSFTLTFVLFLQLFQSIQSRTQCSGNATNAGCFTAAVYEHIRIGDKMHLDSVSAVHRFIYYNLDVIRQVAQLASIKGAKMLVTPEYSIMPGFSSQSVALNGFAVSFPALGSNLCTEEDQGFASIINPWSNPVHTAHKIGEPPVSNDKLLEQIACIAAQSQLYLVVDVVELDECVGTFNCADNGFNLYNTLAVFSPNGTLVAKYRKYRLFVEPSLNHPKKPEVVVFDSEYGRFGLLVCFDIMFEQPLEHLVKDKKIDHLIYSNAWFDEIPLLSGLAFHSGNARRYQVNMLSANLRNLAKGTFGSFIYSADEGVRIQTEFNTHNRLLLASLPIPCETKSELNDKSALNSTTSSQKSAVTVIQEFDPQDDEPQSYLPIEERDEVVIVENSNGDSLGDESQSSNQRCNYIEPVLVGERIYRQHSYLLGDNYGFEKYNYIKNLLSDYKSKRIENTSGRISRLCDGSVCCSLSWRMNPRFNFASDDYYLVALNRLRVKTTYPWYEQACAIVSYSRASSSFKLTASTHFDRIRLTGWFDSQAQFPSLLSSRLQLVPSRLWQFTQTNTTSQITLNDLHQPLAFASIYTRVYDRDRI